MISTRHANFIVNEGGATAADILALIDTAREVVRRKKGVRLELEIQVVGEVGKDEHPIPLSAGNDQRPTSIKQTSTLDVTTQFIRL